MPGGDLDREARHPRRPRPRTRRRSGRGPGGRPSARENGASTAYGTASREAAAGEGVADGAQVGLVRAVGVGAVGRGRRGRRARCWPRPAVGQALPEPLLHERVEPRPGPGGPRRRGGHRPGERGGVRVRVGAQPQQRGRRQARGQLDGPVARTGLPRLAQQPVEVGVPRRDLALDVEQQRGGALLGVRARCSRTGPAPPRPRPPPPRAGPARRGRAAAATASAAASITSGLSLPGASAGASTRPCRSASASIARR